MRYGVKATLRRRRLSALTEACEGTEAAWDGNPLPSSFTVLEGDQESSLAFRDTWRDHPNRRSPVDWAGVVDDCGPTPDEFVVALWDEDANLSGHALLKVQKNSIRIRALERNPDDKQSLTGAVLPLLLEVSSRFAQKLGRREIRQMVTGQDLIAIYCNAYGFEVVEQVGDRATCRREV